jgi:hypothetical protein
LREGHLELALTHLNRIDLNRLVGDLLTTPGIQMDHTSGRTPRRKQQQGDYSDQSHRILTKAKPLKIRKSAS